MINIGLVGGLGFLNKALVHVTNMGKTVTAQQGACNQLWAATEDKGKITNGAYYEPLGVPGTHDKLSKDEKLAEELWEWTRKELVGIQVRRATGTSRREFNAPPVFKAHLSDAVPEYSMFVYKYFSDNLLAWPANKSESYARDYSAKLTSF